MSFGLPFQRSAIVSNYGYYRWVAHLVSKQAKRICVFALPTPLRYTANRGINYESNG